MVVFDLLITFVESFILAAFIAMAFDLIHNIKPLLLLTALFTIETTFFNTVYLSNFLLLFVETITALLFLYYFCKNIQFFNFFIIFLGIAFIMLSNTLSLYLFSLFFDLNVNNISSNSVLYICVVSLSKVIYFIMCLISLKFLENNKNVF